ncbi:MAG TPA: hypothetical protein VD968_05100 [Pyrinomonadaceae bacterium]|nr:hypothetical protein [Pyrinomonadaceae bacterium]
MRRMWATMLLSAALLAGGAAVTAQTSDPGITANGVIGEVVALDAAAKQIFVKTDRGSVVTVTVADSSQFKKLPPGETTLAKATDMTFAQLTAGDRVFARGAVSDDRKTVMARILIVNTKADLEAKRAADRAEWQKRGIVGVVSAVNPQAKEITIQTRTPEGPKPVVIAAGAPGVKLRRYAPDSVRFADAKPSTFEEIKAGDQLRAKGEKSEDGARFTPEEVVTGSFRTTLGAITAVNAEKNEISIVQPMQGGAPLTIVVRPDSVLKQVPAEFAARFAGGPGGPGGAPGAPAGSGQGQQPQQRPAGPPPAAGQPQQQAGGPGGGQPGQGGPRRMGGPDIQQMLEMLPAATLAELKPGQMIVVSSTVGADPSRVTAIQLVAGIEPIVQAMMARQGGGRPSGGGGGGIPSLGGGAAGINFGFGIGQP